MKIGVCYYPEHWPEERWSSDAAHMRKLGISVVRVAEFAWSRLENANGEYSFEWLHRAINTLHAAGLQIVMCTPTATPPRWLLKRHPDILAVDEQGNRREFGSRRHYCFSSIEYRSECKKIVTAIAQEFGEHPGVIAWQTDNEYGCHSTIISYSEQATRAFQRWCKKRYTTIESLNKAWGNVFWSMEYDNFEDIGAPVATVTESNPSHQLAWWRFSSDQVMSFNRLQVDILRRFSPGRDVLHNFMGNFVEFNHHDVAQDLDIASWDNYPLGFLSRDHEDPNDRERYLRTGHPDSSAFHHDLYRGMCNGRWWVMEQQPGPVNWAPFNPAPLPGMVRLWGWEAFAHGAEVMSYFRWRQAPFAQEQLHTGLLRANGDEDVAAQEVAQLHRELRELLSDVSDKHVAITATVAIIFDYTSIAALNIQGPGGEAFDPLRFVQAVYSACRSWGLDIDIVDKTADLAPYRIIIVCCHVFDDESLVKRIAACDATVVLMPGTACKTPEFGLPQMSAPASFRSLIDLDIVVSESLPPEAHEIAHSDSGNTVCRFWREKVASSIVPRAKFKDGWGFHYVYEKIHYINAIPQQEDLCSLLGSIFVIEGLAASELPEGLRIRSHARFALAFNFGPDTIDLDQAIKTHGFTSDTPLELGKRALEPAELAVWVVT